MIRFALVWSALILYAFGCAWLFTALLQVGQHKPPPVTYYCFDPRPETITTFEICELIPQKYNI